MRLFAVILCLLLLSGCGTTVAKLDAAEEVLETKLETIEEAAETTVETVISAPAPEPIAPTLTEADAAAIALEHAGITAEQAERVRISYEVDDGIPEFEVEFFVGATEYDYTVHAETGQILSFEVDD